MKRELRVPPPPTGRTAARHGTGKPDRGASAQRKGSTGGRVFRLAALIAALGLLLTCLLLVVVPAVFSAGRDGRINLLLLGIDRRGGTGWAYRTDTIMVVTLDPGSRWIRTPGQPASSPSRGTCSWPSRAMDRIGSTQPMSMAPSRAIQTAGRPCLNRPSRPISASR